jgi:ACS family allantoate permease-like MFS transporter
MVSLPQDCSLKPAYDDDKKYALEDNYEAGTRPVTECDLRRLYRKVDMVILPVIWLCQGVQQADKLGLATQAT